MNNRGIAALIHRDPGAITGATASPAVLLSGSTFVVALLGMFLVPVTLLRSLAAGAVIVGLVSVAVALTLLPAMLSLIGDRVNSRPCPSWARTSAAPTLPGNLPSKQGYLAVQRYFPGQSQDPVEIVSVGGTGTARADLAKLETVLAGDPRFGPGVIQASPDGKILTLTVPIRGDDVSSQDVAAVLSLRQQLIPSAFAGSGAQVYVGGQTADEADYFHAVTSPTPYVLAFVLGLSFLLLIRLVILPSILSLLGQRSWYLPRRLDWLPHLQADATPGTLLR